MSLNIEFEILQFGLILTSSTKLFKSCCVIVNFRKQIISVKSSKMRFSSSLQAWAYHQAYSNHRVYRIVIKIFGHFDCKGPSAVNKKTLFVKNLLFHRNFGPNYYFLWKIAIKICFSLFLNSLFAKCFQNFTANCT